MPDLDRAIHGVYDTDDVRVIGLFPPEEPAELIQDFKDQTGVRFPLVPDELLTQQLFHFPEGVDFPFPRDVVIGPDLRVRSIKNSFDADEMRDLIEQLLAER